MGSGPLVLLINGSALVLCSPRDLVPRALKTGLMRSCSRSWSWYLRSRLGLGLEGLASNIFRDQRKAFICFVCWCLSEHPAKKSGTHAPQSSLFAFYTLCIRHLWLWDVRCTRTLSCHLHRQTPLLRPYLATTSSKPTRRFVSPMYCVPTTSICPTGDNLQPWRHLHTSPGLVWVTAYWVKMVFAKCNTLFVETLTLLNENSLSDILWHKVNVCVNYVHFVSYCHNAALVLVSNTSILVLPTLVLKSRSWPWSCEHWSWSCHCWSWLQDCNWSIQLQYELITLNYTDTYFGLRIALP